MGVMADINTTLGAMAAATFADTTAIEYRVLTSNPNANPRTYSAWVSLAGARTTDFAETQTKDESNVWIRTEMCSLRVPFTLGVDLSVRHQIRTSGTKVWSVRGQGPRGTAVANYDLESAQAMLGDPRSGGV